MTHQAAAEPAITATGLTRRFGRRTAVDGLDITVDRGEIFGCLGPNGSGKSTLMRMIMGLLEPSAGTATVLGYRVPREAERLRDAVGYMTQQFSLYDDLSVTENLRFAAEIFGLARKERQQRIATILDEFGLGDYRDIRAAALSGGWKQRLALAVATVHRPRLLVLDEPTAGVDPQSRREFWERLFRLAGDGATVLVSTHYMDEAVRCHRLCMLREGRRVALGTPGALTGALAHRVVEVSVPEAEEAIAALSRMPLVASTTQLGDTVHMLLAADAPSAAEAAPLVERFLVTAGFTEARASLAKANLEDVFVALLKGERFDDELA
jgi:ABC-2 type transport system ATP-binding protein